MINDKTVHGGVDLAELRQLGLNTGNIIDFSANISPLKTPAEVRAAVNNLSYESYPDRECLELRGNLAQSTGMSLDNIVIGNGSTELIHLVARAYLGKDAKAVILSPTFGEYEAAARLTGAAVHFVHAIESGGFMWDVARVCRTIKKLEPKLVSLCNPNNPTGVYLSRSSVEEILKVTSENGLLVLDEAYISFANEAWDAIGLLSKGNLLIVRSLTKDYALPGLRLGYALCPGDAARLISRFQPSWSVNAAAQVAGLAALGNRDYIILARQVAGAGSEYLQSALKDLGLRVLPSAANFFLVRVGNAARIRRELLLRGICVRDCSSFGLPQYIRIAARPTGECQKLVEAMKEVLHTI